MSQYPSDSPALLEFQVPGSHPHPYCCSLWVCSVEWERKEANKSNSFQKSRTQLFQEQKIAVNRQMTKTSKDVGNCSRSHVIQALISEVKTGLGIPFLSILKFSVPATLATLLPGSYDPLHSSYVSLDRWISAISWFFDSSMRCYSNYSSSYIEKNFYIATKSPA